MSPHGSPAPGDHRAVEPKHEVFLSHSGAQKGFVRQLDVDLRSWDMLPFFDKDLDSLPIAEKFPERIFKAIEQCQVGVVILSQEFFTLSHWPMTELVGMVKQGRRIMPIFLGISPADLSSGENLQRWRSKWHDWATCNERVKSLQEKIRRTRACSSGVQVVGLYGVGGIGKTTACKSLCQDLCSDFDGRVCHVEFRNGMTEEERVKEVLIKLTDANKEFLKDKNIDEVWSLLKKRKLPNRVFLAIDNVSERNSIEEGKKYLKVGYCQGSIVMVTTRARGDFKYLGIVDGNCHEVPELEESEAKSLFLYHVDVNYEVDEEVLRQCVKRCYFSKGDGRSFHYHPLALKVLGSEMVGEDPSEWVSKVKEVDVFNQRREVTNGVFSILRWSFDLLGEEDKLLFMDVALFDTTDAEYKKWKEVRLLEVDRYILDVNRTWCLDEWLSVVHKSSVDEVKKRLNILKGKSLLEEMGAPVDNLRFHPLLDMERDGGTQIGMHDLWREFAVMETKKGEMEGGRWVYEVVGRKAEDSSLASGGWKDLLRICVMSDNNDYPCVVEGSVKCLNFSNCSDVTVLRLMHVDVENQVLDLSALKQLRSLEIVYAVMVGVYHNEVLKVSGIGLLSNLTLLIWLDISEESVMAVEEISCLTNLQVLQLKSDCRSCRLPMKLDLRQLRWLREVRVELQFLHSILGLSSMMTDLRVLDFRKCGKLRSCPGVGDVVGLEVLLLRCCWRLEELPNLEKLTNLRVLDVGYCQKLESIPGLGSLVALQELLAMACNKLKELPDISNLRNLAVLKVWGCELLKCIPGLGNLLALQQLHVDIEPLDDLPDRLNLTQLHRVEIHGSRGREEHLGVSASSVGDEWNTQELHVLKLGILETVSTLCLHHVDHQLTNLSRLTALKTLELRFCGLESLPHMGKQMGLEKLRVAHCKKLRGWDGVGRSGSSDSQNGENLQCDWTLPHLQVLVLDDSGDVELPDLSHFPRLRKLKLIHIFCDSVKFSWHCRANHMQLETLVCHNSSLTELPDLGKFPCLRKLRVWCESLTSLTISGPLTALESIDMDGCSNLNVLPSVDLFPGLRSLEVVRCGVGLDEQEVEKLRARGFAFSYESWVFNPEPSRDEVVSESELDSNSGEQLPLEGANDVAGPSWREVDSEPRSSEFVPYDECTTECSPVIKRARLQ